jgi:hypothetical protein
MFTRAYWFLGLTLSVKKSQKVSGGLFARAIAPMYGILFDFSVVTFLGTARGCGGLIQRGAKRSRFLVTHRSVTGIG